MPAHSVRLLPLALGLSLATLPLSAAVPIERQIDRTFRVASGSVATVRISGGPIRVETGGAGSVRVVLTTRLETDSEARADEILANFELVVSQQGEEVRVVARRNQDSGARYRSRDERVSTSATLTVPADVRLELHTSGGPITVNGERGAAVKADTSGGTIEVDGGTGALDLDTSGGNIRVGRALSTLRADTSGGGITVQHVGRAAQDVILDTSGGSIHVGVDPAARLNLTASTSGGSVSVAGLPFESQSLSRGRASGTLNGGGGRLTAETSGGSIEIRADRR